MGFIPFLDFGSFNIDPAQTTIFASSGSKYIYAGGDGEAPYYSGIFAFTIPGTAGQLSSISGAGFFDPQIPFGGVTGMTMDGLGRFIYLSDYGAYINYVREFTMSPSGQMQEGPIITDKSAMQWTIQAADPTGKFVYAWYYSANGNIALTVFTVDASTGVLTEVAGSPFLVAAGSSTVPSGTFQFLGGSIVFSPTGKFLYASVANYPVTQNSTFTNDYIYTFSIDPLTGSLSPVAGSPVSLPNTAVVPLAMHPDGKFLYASPRPSNSAPAPGILMFPIDATTGAIMDTPVSVGGGNQYYRQMLIDPSGNVLLAITPGISSFTINSTTGLLTSAGTATTASGTAASCGSSVIAKIP